MTWEYKEEFYSFILTNKVVGCFKDPLKLKSGRISHWYVNWRTIAEDVFLIDQLTEFVLLFIKHLRITPNCFYGVPEGATKLAILLQYKWALRHGPLKPGKFPLSMGRGKPKDHGDLKDQFFLGYPKGDVLIIEDTTTTGNSLLASINLFKKMKINILATLGLTNRNELRDDGKSVGEAINEHGIPYYAMSNALELLPRLKISETMKKHIINYFKSFGEQEIKF